MLRIGVLVSGGGTNLQAVIDAVKRGYIKAEIAAVVSSKEKAYALERAKQNGIEAVCMRKRDYKDLGEDAYEKALIAFFAERGIGLVLTAGFNTILSEYFVRSFENKVMNVHPTLIPSFCGKGYYGLRVHEEVIKSGVKLTGATVHFVNEITDGGPIIIQKAIEVLDNDTPEVLQKRVMEEAEQVIYPEAVKLFAENRLRVVEGRVFVDRN